MATVTRRLTTPDGEYFLIPREAARKGGRIGSALLTREERSERGRHAVMMRWAYKRGEIPRGHEWTRKESVRFQARVLADEHPTDQQLSALAAEGLYKIGRVTHTLTARQRRQIDEAWQLMDTALEKYRQLAKRAGAFGPAPHPASPPDDSMGGAGTSGGEAPQVPH
jgi:hypothetical protein